MSWGIVAAAGIGLVGGMIQGSDQEDQQQATAQNNKDTANLTTQREIWLAQQQRKWDVQDKATARAQKQADIGVFQKYHANAADYKPSANLFQQEADATQGPNFDPTQLGSLSQLAGGSDAAQAPQPVAGSSGGAVPGRGDNIDWVV